MNIVIEKDKYGVIKQNDIKAMLDSDKALPLEIILLGGDKEKLEAIFFKTDEKIKNIFRELDGKIRQAKKSELVKAGVETIPTGKRINEADDDYEDLPLTHYKLKDGKPIACIEVQAELAAEKMHRKEEISQASFNQRQKIYPDFKLQNASLGVYGEQEKKQAIALVQAFRKEFDRCAVLIDSCKTIKEVREVMPTWPSYPYGEK